MPDKFVIDEMREIASHHIGLIPTQNRNGKWEVSFPGKSRNVSQPSPEPEEQEITVTDDYTIEEFSTEKDALIAIINWF